MSTIIFDNQYLLFEQVSGTTAASVTAVGSAVPGTTLSFSTTGMGTITSATLTDSLGNVLTLTGVTNTTADLPALADEQQYCLFGTVTLTVSDGVNSPQDTLPLAAASGFAYVALESGFSTSETSYLYQYGGTPAVPDQFVYETANLVLNSDGTFEASAAGPFTIYAIDATDGYMQSFQLQFAHVSASAAHQAATATHEAAAAVEGTVGGVAAHQAARATADASGTVTPDVVVAGTAAHAAARATHAAAGTSFTVIMGSAAHQAARATAAVTGGFKLPRPIRNPGLTDLTPVYGITSA